MKIIASQEDFLNTELYYPSGEWDWVDLYKKILGSYEISSVITVKEVAKYLLENVDYSTPLVDKIRKLEINFNRHEFCVDLCPSKWTEAFYLRGGNKRSIAYGMRLLNGESFQKVRVRDWQETWEGRDLENLRGLPTTDEPVIKYP